MKYFATIFGLLILIASCGKLTETDPKFVIEGYLFAGEPVRGIRIKRQSGIHETDSIQHLIENAQVVIIKGGREHFLHFEDGEYLYDGVDLSVETGDLFRIEVTVDGRMAYAETTVPQATTGLSITSNKLIVPVITLHPGLLQQLNQLFNDARLTARWSNPRDELHFVVIEPVVVEYDSIFPSKFPQNGRDFLSSFKFAPAAITVDSFSIIGIAFETYGRHRVKVYRVNQEYANLFNNPNQDSRDLGEPPSNVVNGFGIFSAFAADSVFFDIARQ